MKLAAIAQQSVANGKRILVLLVLVMKIPASSIPNPASRFTKPTATRCGHFGYATQGLFWVPLSDLCLISGAAGY